MVIRVVQLAVFPLASVATAVTVEIPRFIDAEVDDEDANVVAPAEEYVIEGVPGQSSVAEAGKFAWKFVVPQGTVLSKSPVHTIEGLALSTIGRNDEWKISMVYQK